MLIKYGWLVINTWLRIGKSKIPLKITDWGSYYDDRGWCYKLMYKDPDQTAVITKICERWGVNAGVIIYHKDNGRFNDGGYTARILPNDQILTEIAKHWGVWYDRGKLRTKSDRDREYYNLVQAILEANAYKEFAKWGWTKC